MTSTSSTDLHHHHGVPAPKGFFSFDTIVENIQAADVVISHAGVGSVLCAIRAGHTPVLFPRLKRYNEAVDDHQVELAEALADRGTAVVAWTADDLSAAVASAPPSGAGKAVQPNTLIEAVRATIISGRTLDLAALQRALVGNAT